MNQNSPLLGSLPEEEFKSFARSVERSSNPNFLNRPTSFFGVNAEKHPNPPVNDNDELLPREKSGFFKSLDEKPSINPRDTQDFEENRDLLPRNQIKTGTFHLNLKRIALLNIVFMLTVGLFPLVSILRQKENLLYINDSFFLEKQAFFSVISGIFLVLLFLLFHIDDVKNESLPEKSTIILAEQLPGFTEKLAEQIRLGLEEFGWKIQSVTLIFDEGESENGERRGSLNKTNNLSRFERILEGYNLILSGQ